MVAGCLYPILKSSFKTEGKNLSQWKQWSHSHLHSVRAWPCDLSPYFIALAKLTTCSWLGTGGGRGLGHRIYGAKCQLSEEQEKLAQGWCSWLLILFLFPSASTPGKSSIFFLRLFSSLPLSVDSSRGDSTTCPLQRLDTWARTFWCSWVWASSSAWNLVSSCQPLSLRTLLLKLF